MDSVTYLRALNQHFTYLWAYARRINEIDTAAAVSGEFRGIQDSGWSTVQTAYEVFDELKILSNKGAPLTRPELRQVLSLYAQLSEAGGVYECLLNTMQVAQLKAYNLWPFQDLVRVRPQPRAVIGPNANAMFRRMAEVATAIGMPGLAGLLEIAFRDDIRNGMAHADYILGQDGLRLRRRNGGNPVVVSLEQMRDALQIAMFFFELLQAFRRETAESFRPARTIIGRFSDNFPMAWTIQLSDEGSFSISSSAAGPQVDTEYERQQRINNHLGGRVAAVYLAAGADAPGELLKEIEKVGFDPLVVAMGTAESYDALIAQVEAYSLWDAGPETAKSGVLMATPFGFRWIASGSDFCAWLPLVDDIKIE